MAFIKKYLEKFAYLVFLGLLDFTFLIISILSLFFYTRPAKKKRGDIILYPYAFVGSDGFLRRFLEYVPYFEKNAVAYKICPLFTDTYARRQLKRNAFYRYLFYLRVLWKRIPQVLESRHYRAAFIQRGLFPVYFDLEFPHLERMMRKLNNHITIDIWDSIFERQGLLVSETIKYTDQLSLSNEFLMHHFSDYPGKRTLWKIAVNLKKYRVKEDYSISGKARIFWTGLPHNISFLEKYLPLFKEISGSHPLTLVLVCQKSITFDGLDIEYHNWDETDFFTWLHSADIGIYPEFNSIISKGKSAMKVMDYLATALPMIGVPYGLPSEAAHGRELLIADSFTEWKKMLTLLIEDENLRKTLGQNGRKMVEKHYSLDQSYEVFKSFALPTSH
jgi:glycosyltransferase involved in cell wall biosynthesis